ncbi:MAG TPA: ABC transporter permease subunit [Flavitalea sp.]|nr:ABC transporter permease subunit [Flavitalea sp.]
MLLYKSWLETRVRFYIGIVFISFLCLFFVLGHPYIIEQWALDKTLHPEWKDPWWLPQAKSDYVYFLWHFLYNYLLQFLWVLFTILLSLGSLSYEAEKGSVLFTLSLPLTRSKLFLHRNLMGLLQAAFLALLPAVLLPLGSAIIGQHYPVSLALEHTALFITGGFVFYSLGLLLNSLIETESISFFVSIAGVIVFYFLFQPYAESQFVKPLWMQYVDLPGILSGNDNGHALKYFPWNAALLCVCVSGILFLISYRIIRKKNY